MMPAMHDHLSRVKKRSQALILAGILDGIRHVCGTPPFTIAFDMAAFRPAHPALQKELGATIPMSDFYALFPNSNMWESDVGRVWVFYAMPDELRKASKRLKGNPEVIFVDEEGP